MLSLQLRTGNYMTIGDEAVVQLNRRFLATAAA